MLRNYLLKILSGLSNSKKVLTAFGSLTLLLSIITLIDFSLSKNKTSYTTDKDYYNIANVRIAKVLFFANEKVPVEDKKVREMIAHEIIKNTYWQKQSLLFHQRSSRWFPVIVPILKKYNIPEDFKYIALVESQLTNVVSPKGAAGFWQIIEITGYNYGLEITEDVDERYDVIKSTKAACNYFRQAYKQLNNWTLVAASYNKGVVGIQRQLRIQKTNNYYQLKLNKETGHYVYKILAMKELIESPKVYGLKIKTKNYKIPYGIKKITVDSSINNLEAFSKSNGIDLNTLKLLNPWLISNKLTNELKKKYIIELPKKSTVSKEMKSKNGIENNLSNKKIAISDSIKIITK